MTDIIHNNKDVGPVGKDEGDIVGGDFRRKFDLISEDKELNKLLYQLAKKMLEHRSGTVFEDMYWIDVDSCEVVAKELESKNRRKG